MRLHEKIMQICQNRPLDKFMRSSAFMHSNVWCNKNLSGTNLCDLHLTRIIHINKSHAEICHFRVFNDRTATDKFVETVQLTSILTSVTSGEGGLHLS